MLLRSPDVLAEFCLQSSEVYVLAIFTRLNITGLICLRHYDSLHPILFNFFTKEENVRQTDHWTILIAFANNNQFLTEPCT